MPDEAVCIESNPITTGDMDKKTIFEKTSKGESEVSGMSGDMKRVLLLIDGNTSYAEIIKHAPPSLRGDIPEIIQSLLDSELIRDKSKVRVAPKIVAPKVVAPKVVTPKVEQGREELDFTSMFIAPDAAALAAEAARAKAVQEAETLKASQEVAKQKAELEARARAVAEARERAEQEAARVKAELDAAARAKAEAEAAALIKAEQEARMREEEQALAAEQERAWAEAEQRAEQQSKLDAAQAAKEAALAQAKRNQKSTATRRRNPLPLGKIAAGILALGLVAIYVLPMFWPMQEYIAPLEQRLSERFKQPVKVGGMSASLLPVPKIELVEVKVGAAGEFSVATAMLNFDLLSLLSDSKTISNATLQGATLNGRDMETVVGWLKGMGGDARFPLQHVILHDLKIISDVVSIPVLQGGADFDQGAFSRLVLHSEDEKFNVEIKAAANRTQLAFGIRDGSLPLLPGAIFSSFNARGEIAAGEISISDLDAHAYGGIWSGNGKLNWSRGWRFDASIKAKTMELAELFPKYGLSGEVFIDGKLSASAGTLPALAKSLRIDGSFEAKRGVINGIDVVETVRLASHEHLVGGRTHFDELNGSFVAEDGQVRFRSVRITSRMLKASGTLNATTGGQLSGEFNAEIKMRSGTSLLSLSGTLSEPRLQAR